MQATLPSGLAKLATQAGIYLGRWLPPSDPSFFYPHARKMAAQAGPIDLFGIIKKKTPPVFAVFKDDTVRI